MNMKRDSIMKWNRILGALVVVGAFWACSDGDKTAGTSEEAEGITAISDKRITGVSQKGPFVKGSDVVLVALPPRARNGPPRLLATVAISR